MSVVPRPGPEHATQAVPLERLQRGRSLYVAKCGGCHTLYPVASRGDAAWRESIREMRKENVTLTDEQARDMEAYLTALNGESN